MGTDVSEDLVSVIMPGYNCAEHVARAVNSVMGQTHTHLELIFVDDGSEDGSSEIVSSFNDARIRQLRQANTGVSRARNNGIDHSHGRFIAFLDSDDTWDPHFLGRMLEALDANPDAALAYCGWQNLGLEGGRGEPFVPPDYEIPEKQVVLLGGNRWPVHAALTRRESIVGVNGFNEHFVIGEDHLLWLEIACFGRIVRVPHVLAYYHHHDGIQATKNKHRRAKELWEVKRTFLRRHPETANKIGTRRIRENTHGKLLEQAYEYYWRRDLDVARSLFRVVMRHGYGTVRDWKYMLPSVLPISWHRKLVSLLQSADG